MRKGAGQPAFPVKGQGVGVLQVRSDGFCYDSNAVVGESRHRQCTSEQVWLWATETSPTQSGGRTEVAVHRRCQRLS